MKQLRIAAATAALGGMAGGAVAQVTVDIAPCVGIESAVARLDCYDALARDAAAEPAAAPPAAAPARAPAAEPARARSGRDATAPDGAPADEEITSEVVRLREILPGRLEIELANGQVWRQTSSDRYRLQVGHAVRLYPTRFGGQYFRLTAPAIRGFVQVERVR